MNDAGSSFASFINPLETIGEEDEYEVVFQNDSLSQTLTKVPSSDNSSQIEEEQSLSWSQFIRRAAFTSKPISTPFSILAIAKNRYSEQILSQVYQLVDAFETAEKDSPQTITI